MSGNARLPSDATMRALVSVLNTISDSLDQHLKLQCILSGVTPEQLRDFDPANVAETEQLEQSFTELARQKAMEAAAIQEGYEVTEDTDFDDQPWEEEQGEVGYRASRGTIVGPGYGD